MLFREGDIIKTKSDEQHKTVVELLVEFGYMVTPDTWRDREQDYANQYNILYYDGIYFESVDRDCGLDELVVIRKIKAKKVLENYNTQVKGSKLRHYLV